MVSMASTNLVGRDRRADQAAQGGVLVGAAAEGNLIEFFALLIDAEDADMPHMVVATGVDGSPRC